MSPHHTSSTGLQTRPMDPGIPHLPFSAPAPGSLTLKLPPLTRASHYGDAMRELDDAIGQILEQVRLQKSSRRATLVLFTSDNGADLNARERAGGRDSGRVSLPQDQVDRCSVASRQLLKEVSSTANIFPICIRDARPHDCLVE